MGDVIYMNSGDWVESLSALVEDYNGNWSLIYYNEEANTSKEPTISEFFGQKGRLAQVS
jgi:hypothetical protein